VLEEEYGLVEEVRERVCGGGERGRWFAFGSCASGRCCGSGRDDGVSLDGRRRLHLLPNGAWILLRDVKLCCES
jgi:hypothetical protein